MAEVFREDFDGLADGTAITAANTAFDASSGDGTREADTAFSVTGGVSCAFICATITENVRLDDTFTATGSRWFRWYFRPPDPLILANRPRLAALFSGGTHQAGLLLENDGRVTIINGSSAAGTTTTAVTPGEWHRLEWGVVNGGDNELRLFVGANVHGTVPDDTVSAAYSEGTFDSFTIGPWVARDAWTHHVDSVVADDAGFPGPESVGGGLGDVIRSFASPGGQPRGLAWDGTNLWHCDFGTLTIYKLDPADGSQRPGSFASPGSNPAGLAWDGTDLWHCDFSTDTIYKLDPATGSTITSFASPAGIPTGLTWDGTNLWVATQLGTDTIHQINTAGTVLDSFAAPGAQAQGLAWDGTNLWHTDSGTHTVYKLDPATGSVLDSFASPSTTPRGLAWDGADLWHVDSDTDTIYLLEVTSPILEMTGAGGVTVGGAATIEFDTALVAVTGAGGIRAGGAADTRIITPTFITGAGGLLAGGAATVIISGPQVASDVVVEWDVDNDGDFDQAVEDITQYVRAAEAFTGRDWPSLLTGKAGPGKLRVTLRNDDDRFSFFNQASPLNQTGRSLRTGRKLRVRTTEAADPDPALLARDRFRRANGPLGDTENGLTWTQPLADDFEILTEEAAATGEGGEHVAVVDVAAADYYAQVTITETGAATTGRGDNTTGLVYRYQDSSNYSLFVLITDLTLSRLVLIDVVAGTPTEIDDFGIFHVYDRMTIGVLVSGGEVTAYLEGVPVRAAAAPQADETHVGIYAEWGVGNSRPALDDFHVWDGLPAEVEGILWTGDVSDLITSVQAGPDKVATIEGKGWLSRLAGQRVRPPSSVRGRETGLLVGNTLAMARLLHPPGSIDLGDVFTGPFGMAEADALEVARRFEETEFGFLYESQEGPLTYEERTARDGSTPVATFTDQPGGQFGFHELTPMDWRREVVNRVFAGVAAKKPSGESLFPSREDANVGFSTLYRISGSGDILGLILPPELDTTGLTWDGNSLWVADSVTDLIYRLDVDGTILDSFNAPAGDPSGLTHDGTNLWAADATAATIYKLNPSTGTQLDSFAAPGTSPEGLAWDGTSLWNVDSDTNTVYELDPATGTVTSSFAAPGDFPHGLAWDGEHLIVTNFDSAKSGSLIYTVDLDSTLDPQSVVGPGIFLHGVTWDGSNLWVVAAGNPVRADIPFHDAGDLLVAAISAHEQTEWFTPAGWTDISRSAPAGARIFAQTANASTAQPDAVAFGQNNASADRNAVAAHVYRITDWFGDLSGGLDVGEYQLGSDPRVLFPPWGFLPTLFVAVRHGLRGSSASVSGTQYPIGYVRGESTTASTTNADVAIESARRFDVVEVENPGAFEGTFSGFEVATVVFAVRGPNVNPDGTTSADAFAVVQADDVDSQDDHNAIRTHRLSSNLFANETDATAYAELVLARFADDRPILALKFFATKSAAYRAQAIRRRVGDRITVVADGQAGLGIRRDFFIESIGHRWTRGTRLWETTWELSPA